MPRTTPTSPLASRATPPLSPTAAGTPSRLAVAPASPSTPQCAIPASPHTPGRRAAAPSTPPPATPRTPRPEITLRQPLSQASSQKHNAPAAVRKPSSRALRAIRALFRSLPIIAPAACRPGSSALPRRYTRPHDGHGGDGARVTGTFYGHRRARITLAVQERPGSLPSLVLELGVPTGKLMQEISTGGHIRIALECEKKAKKSPSPSPADGGSVGLLEEAMWTAYVNGRRVGYAVRREATEGDLAVMQLLSTVSVGAGVLPGDIVDVPAGEADGEVTYMRAGFDRVIGSKDSESFYMVSPEGDAGGGTELSIFFVRV
ncbi:hypothetical protein EJB05_03892, partial [Eragrostis curvula]